MKNSNTIYRGVFGGGAHMGPGSGFAFGRRCPLLAPNDDGNGAGGGGGASSGTTTTTATTGDPATAPGAAGNEKSLPQSQVNTLVANARREGRESALRERQSSSSTTAAPKGEAASPAPADDAQATISRYRAFDRAVGAAGLNERQLARMEAAFNAEKPSDVSAWSTNYLEDMGLVRHNPSTSTSTSQQAAAAAETRAPAAAAPSSSQPSVSQPITSDGLTNIYSMTPEQFAATPATRLKELHEQNVAAAQARSGAPPIPRPTTAKR